MAQWKMIGKAFLAVALMAGPAVAAAADSTGKAPTTKPVGGGALEVRAETAFNRSEWSLALPMLKQVADAVKDNPDRLATIQEQIRVCERNIAKATAAASVALAAPATQPTAEARKPIPAPKAGQVTDMMIKDLGNFDY